MANSCLGAQPIIFFITFINNLDEDVQGLVSTFADDTEISDFVDHDDGCQEGSLSSWPNVVNGV